MRATSDPWWMKMTVLALCLTFMLVFFALPLGLLFQEALRKGWDAYLKSFADKATMHSVWLSLKVAAIAVPLNTLFGLSAAWCVAHRVKILGVEPPSIADVNHLPEVTRIHKVLLGGGVTIVEGLAFLDRLTQSRVFFHALPLRLASGDGCPVRAFAYDTRPETWPRF